MAIEINGLNNPHAANIAENQHLNSNRPDRASASPTSGQNQSDTVQFTQSAQQLQQLEGKINSLPIQDNFRIDQVRFELDQGIYEVNSENVAEKLLQFEASLPTA